MRSRVWLRPHVAAADDGKRTASSVLAACAGRGSRTACLMRMRTVRECARPCLRCAACRRCCPPPALLLLLQDVPLAEDVAELKAGPLEGGGTTGRDGAPIDVEPTSRKEMEEQEAFTAAGVPEGVSTIPGGGSA